MTPKDGKLFDAEAQSLAVRLRLGSPALIARGTEACVYSLNSTRVLKVYPSPAALPRIRSLQEFYDRASTTDVGFAIPRIHGCGATGSIAYSVEDRLAGLSMADIVGFVQDPHMADMYIGAVLDIRHISFAPSYSRRKLLDPNDTSGDWSDYLCGELSRKAAALRERLPSEVFAKLGPVDALAEHLASAYSGPDLLIHGDFHPGNVLVTNKSRVSAVVDFGTFTMFGDPLYDVATACAFFSMYEAEQVATRKKMLARVLQRDGSLDSIRIRAYLLAASVLTCDLYPDEKIPVYQTGHFAWALSVLGDPEMWAGISDLGPM